MWKASKAASLLISLLLIGAQTAISQDQLLIALGPGLNTAVVPHYTTEFAQYFGTGTAHVFVPEGQGMAIPGGTVHYYRDMHHLAEQMRETLCASSASFYSVMLFPTGGPDPGSIAEAISDCGPRVRFLSTDYSDRAVPEICRHLSDPGLVSTFTFDKGVVVPDDISSDSDDGVVVPRPWWPYLTPVVVGPTIFLITGDNDKPLPGPCDNDATPPVLTKLPQDFISDCVDNAAFLAWRTNHGGAVATDENEIVWSDDYPGNPVTCGMSGTVRFLVADVCGNGTSAEASYQIGDGTAPVISTAAVDFTAECDGGAELTQWLESQGGASASDNCGSITWTNDFPGVSGNCDAAVIVTFTARDACGNESTTQAMVTIADQIPPEIGSPATDFSAACVGGPEFDAWLSSNGNASATDNCGSVTWTNDFTGVLGSCDESTVITFSATDGCGNVSTTQATVTIADQTPPEIGSPATDFSAACEGGPEFDAWLSSNGNASATDNCGSVTWTNDFTGVLGSCDESTVITFSATDGCGNVSTTQATVTIADQTPPEIANPATDFSAACEGGPEFDAWLSSNGEASATDNCGTITWTNDFSGTLGSCDESTVITFSATDGCGNVSTTQATVTIADQTPPEIANPASDFNAACEGGPEFDAWLSSNGEASATDNCGTVTWTNDFSGSLGSCDESVMITFSATDACGNVSTTQATVTIADQTPPEIASPATDFSAACEGGTEFDDWLSSNGTATATDNCGIVTWTNDFTGTPGSCDESTMIVFTATDGCGNTSTTQATVTIADQTAPEIVQVANDFSDPCEGGAGFADWLDTQGGAMATDNCGDVTWSHDFTGELGTCDVDMVVTFTATDGCGNTAITQAVVTISDTSPPAIDQPAGDFIEECEGGAAFTAWLDNNGGAVATDNCGTVTWSHDFTGDPGTCDVDDIVTFTATDACGNTSTTQAVLMIQDTQAPAITTGASDENSVCGGATEFANWLDTQGGAVATDNCGAFVWTNDYTGGTPDCNTPTLVTFTATDECGNASTTAATITLEDVLPPELIDVPADMVVPCEAIPEPASVSASDNCPSTVTLVFDETLAPGCPYEYTRTWTATDACGNESTGVQVITGEDNIRPEPTFIPPNEDIFCPPPCNECSFPPPVPVEFGDNCDPAPQVFMETEIFGGFPGTATAEHRWWSNDACGNQSDLVVVTVNMTCFEEPPLPIFDDPEIEISFFDPGPYPLLGPVTNWRDWGASTAEGIKPAGIAGSGFGIALRKKLSTYATATFKQSFYQSLFLVENVIEENAVVEQHLGFELKVPVLPLRVESGILAHSNLKSPAALQEVRFAGTLGGKLKLQLEEIGYLDASGSWLFTFGERSTGLQQRWVWQLQLHVLLHQSIGR